MAIFVKNAEQVQKMRKAGRVVAETLQMLKKDIKPGITTGELDRAAGEFIRSKGAEPTFLGYRGFPANICISVNEQVIHGIGGIRRLKSGDIVSVDVGATVDGFVGDAARTFPVGEINEADKRLISVTEQSFFEGIRFARSGFHLHEISGAIGDYVAAAGFGIVRDFIGHGVGAKLHESPEIPNFRLSTRGPRLMPGMTLAIEPMVNAGTGEVYVLPDDSWTVVTADGRNSAHYENTILITDGEPELLTAY